jgi:photosystem II stability/assembly factor-like uncharacterized protein
MKTYFVIVCLFFITIYHGSAQYTWLNPLPQGNYLYDIYTLDSLTCWAAGGYGTILKTTNGGNTWSVLNSGTTETFRSICFPDYLNGWACTSQGKIFKSVDGGISWEIDYTSVDCMFLAIDFTSSLHGCAVGGVNGTSEIIMTWDGGRNWWIIKKVPSGGKLLDVCFVDNEFGCTVSNEGMIYRTFDGGMNWSLVLDEGPFIWFEMVSFVDRWNGWAGDTHDGKIYITNDGGSSWTITHPGFIFSDLSYVSPTVGYSCGENFISGIGYESFVKKSINGGNLWVPTGVMSMHITTSLAFASPLTGWIVGSSGTIIKTENGGESWTQQTFDYTKEHLADADFMNDGEIGWALGGYGTIIHTHDFGQTWELQTEGVTAGLTAIEFIDTLNGWACGVNGTLIHTLDGGNTWNNVNIPTTAHCIDISFPYSSFGSIACDSGIILVTNDGGQNWTKSEGEILIELYSINFIDSLMGWVTGRDFGNDWWTFIGKTIDGGLTWDTLHINQYSQLESIFFINELKGWAVGNDSLMLRTIDGGNNWIIETCPYSGNLNVVYFKDEDNGVVAGYPGVMMTTTNGGISYEPMNSGTSESIEALYVNSEGDIWAFGTNGCIIAYPQILTGINEMPPLTEHPSLLIYPNPFSDHTLISYNLFNTEDVTVKLYSISGETVMTVFEGVQEKGNHEYQLHNSNLVPGIYLCEVKTKSQKLSGKLIISR